MECLSNTMYGEARGEPIEGIVSIGSTLLTRKAKWKPAKSTCHHSLVGYKPKEIPANVRPIFEVLANGLISGRIKDPTRGADSFDSIYAKPKGHVTREIGKHRFYIAVRGTN